MCDEAFTCNGTLDQLCPGVGKARCEGRVRAFFLGDPGSAPAIQAHDRIATRPLRYVPAMACAPALHKENISALTDCQRSVYHVDNGLYAGPPDSLLPE